MAPGLKRVRTLIAPRDGGLSGGFRRREPEAVDQDQGALAEARQADGCSLGQERDDDRRREACAPMYAPN